MTKLELLKFDLDKNGNLGKYVILRYSEEKGFYLEYAFKDGAPHDNTCIDWYSSYQPEAYERNGWFKGMSEKEKEEEKQKHFNQILEKTGKIYRLGSCTCGGEEDPWEKLEEMKIKHPGEPITEDNVCRVGRPACQCRESHARNWTKKEPVKCACWSLMVPGKTLEEFMKSYSCCLPLNEILKLINNE